MPVCVVSFLDPDGVRHAVEVEANTMYEAAVLGLSNFKKHDCHFGEMSQLEIEVRSSIVHTVYVHKVRAWLSGGAKSPKEMVMKERLKSLL
jgi:hypothetical protein